MYQVQHAHVGYGEFNFSAVWRKVAKFTQKITLTLQNEKMREVVVILEKYENDQTMIIRSLRKF